MKTLETLENMRSLLSEEQNWTQRAFARNIEGETTGTTSSDACSWCLLGAMWQFY